MAELDLTTIFNDCIDRITQGQSIDDCLRRYPQYASTLRPMLETGVLVQRMRVQPAEVLAAQTHVRPRFEDALRAPSPRRMSNIPRFVYALAAILIIAFVSVGSLTALSQNSLPGDSLYGAKLFSEGLQRTLFDNDALETNFNQRRIQEIQQLIALGRSEDVAFTGIFTTRNAEDWIVGSLAVTVPAGIPNSSSAQIGDKLAVTGRTSESHSLTATSIQVIEPASTPPTTATPTQTTSPTFTMTPTLTATLTATKLPATATPVPPTQVSPATPTTLPPTECVPALPNGWVAYQIRSGDTLSGLASGQSISLAELMTINCITDARRIVVGETIYLPSTPTIAPTTASNNNNQGSGSNNSGSNNSGSNTSGNPNPNPTDDHGGGDNSGHGNSGGGSGSGNSGGGGSDDGSGHH